MHAALVYPPFGDPRAPQLALPSLAAFLRLNGASVSMHDLNLDGLESLAQGAQIESMRERLDRRLARLGRNDAPEIWRGRLLVDQLVEAAPAAFDELRQAASFHDPGRFASARGVLANLLFVASQASAGIAAELSPIRYDVAGCDPARLEHLLRLGADADLFAVATAQLVDRLEAESPDLVGITITNRQQMTPGLLLARRLKARGFRVVIGGAVFTKFADALRRLPQFFEAFASEVVVYEGETALLTLLQAAADGGDTSSIPNVLSLQDGRVRAGPILVEDVSRLPTPDFEGLPLGRYLTPEPVLPILTGKGCYFNRCKFCDIPFINHVSRKAYRVRPPEAVVGDVHTLHERFGARAFVITDEALSPRLLGTLADAFDARPGAFGFTGYARLEPGFDAQTCARAAGFGMKKLFFGLESASQAVVDHMAKGVRIDAVPEVLRNCRAAGIDFHLFGMAGLPEETADQARETYRFLVDQAPVLDAPGSSFDIHPFGLELRTPYFDEREKYGVVVSPAALDRDFVIGLSPTDWTNPRGLDGAAARALIEDEFAPGLRRTYGRWHGAGDPLWPPQEEYAVLYALGPAASEFPWLTTLPSGPFAFVPDHARARISVAGAVLLVDAHAEIAAPEGLWSMIEAKGARTWLEHLTRWPGAPPEADAREWIHALIGLGALRLRLVEPAAP